MKVYTLTAVLLLSFFSLCGQNKAPQKLKVFIDSSNTFCDFTFIRTLCSMPRGQSGQTRIGTFACRSDPTAYSKQAKEPILSTHDNKTKRE